jgi:hypothetical protein
MSPLPFVPFDAGVNRYLENFSKWRFRSAWPSKKIVRDIWLIWFGDPLAKQRTKCGRWQLPSINFSEGGVYQALEVPKSASPTFLKIFSS